MEITAVVEGIRPYLIHGERYAIVYFSRVGDPDNIQQAQLSSDALPGGLSVGESIRVTFIGSVVVAIERRDAEQGPGAEKSAGGC